MTLKDLGLDVEDYLRYIRGDDMDAEKERLIDEHWDDLEIVTNKHEL